MLADSDTYTGDSDQLCDCDDISSIEKYDEKLSQLEEKSKKAKIMLNVRKSQNLDSSMVTDVFSGCNTSKKMSIGEMERDIDALDGEIRCHKLILHRMHGVHPDAVPSQSTSPGERKGNANDHQRKLDALDGGIELHKCSGHCLRWSHKDDTECYGNDAGKIG